jgi:hypothetical protein
MTSIEEDFWLELAQIQAESIGWIPLDEGAYLHVGSDAPVIQVVGVAKGEMAGSNVLWLLFEPPSQMRRRVVFQWRGSFATLKKRISTPTV